MLNRRQKEKIRRIEIYKYSVRERRGKAVDDSGKEFKMLSFDEIRDEVYKMIREMGFSKIEYASPLNANCVIRVFQKKHYHYDGMTYNVYGAQCFTKKDNQWTTKNSSGETKINFSKCKFIHWICQYDYIDFDFDFFDCYVRIDN